MEVGVDKLGISEKKKMMMTMYGHGSSDNNDHINDDDNYEVNELPGFRFHPTDEELVGFYLLRKVQKKSFTIELLIKQVDIYKYDPWDLPKVSSVGENKEWYFFCMRGRKYRNSIRPNRVTGSGFWKATGIDKPIYSSSSSSSSSSSFSAGLQTNNGERIIGLKKSLVYYRGSAGKGTKTDWMMHEFRLPPAFNNSNHNSKNNNIAQEAEVWTLCRIFKRNTSNNYKRFTPLEWKQKHSQQSFKTTANSRIGYNSSCSSSFDSQNNNCSYISFKDAGASPMRKQNDENIAKAKTITTTTTTLPQRNKFCVAEEISISQQQYSPLTSTSSSFWNNNPNGNANDFFTNGNCWDELRSVVEFALDPSVNIYGQL